ncbi:hypothetical protein HMPREF9094_2631 [Fusobacterium animalis ATCC 51191]|uniref:SpoVT-AbrB domain-containing protein n=1 Tax=Fusobacterium animalis ATCC 51191 TaxID=997347 RepID=F9ERS6_9FUSO|nr:hypothetical protein HMPREF9094_2631 [Fusobacterium animalis ATCC 51191]
MTKKTIKYILWIYKIKKEIIFMEVLRVQKWGNSQGIRLPKKILKDLKIDINDKIEISLNGEEIILKK